MTYRPRWYSLVLLGCLGISIPFSAHAETPQAPRRPDVLLITIDTLRPDALGWIGGKNATPNLDALAAEGVRFPAAVSPVPITLPAHTSLMTALIPPRHGVRDNGQLLGSGAQTLAEALQTEGYATAAFVSGYPLSPEFGLDRGFDRYDGILASDGGPLEWSAAETTRRALEWLSTAPRPWFLWIHYYDPHDPYEPPQRLLKPGPRGAYDGEVAAVDEALGALLAGAAKASANRLTVFTADHAESLGEHGERTHGFFIYDSTTLVPLVFHWPGKLKPLEPKAEHETLPRLIDVAPTICALLGLPEWNGVDGESLLPLLTGRPQQIPAAYLESLRPWHSYGWAPLKGMRREGWKLIVAPRPELYELSSDHAEAVNRIDDQPNPARRIAGALRSAEQQPALASSSAVDAETLARLRSLGYTGGAAGTGSSLPDGLADPKDRIDAWNLLGDAEAELGAGRPEAALSRFDQVLEKAPDNPFALARSGFALLVLDRVDEAVPRL
ncbi:MAG: sulfatase-like hydrolase/transferase, partial [Acidobacteria bacterium]|nr:sulfatase-like hydrolase/transferase [Acidobacteriota bacterium]